MHPKTKYHKYRLVLGHRTENYNQNPFYLALTWNHMHLTHLLLRSTPVHSNTETKHFESKHLVRHILEATIQTPFSAATIQSNTIPKHHLVQPQSEGAAAAEERRQRSCDRGEAGGGETEMPFLYEDNSNQGVDDAHYFYETEEAQFSTWSSSFYTD
ncbi:hypothetical protein Ccrd_020967 [Cynara cardunculus var. scolymus]|uniref:Uncharacterized protein n=1 Tax=Cynara cardunculus var. scolymus TaxID=59895 RepID=A0A118K061_CYNCS|nr:hypothetical protein Ccrd_020967 [Cynara cardunculus var. scolymus]